jgi:hypothetical protein
MAFGQRLIQGAMVAVVFTVAAYGLGRIGIINWPAHYDPLALPDLNEQPYFLTQTRLKLIDGDGQSCRLALARAGLNFRTSAEKGAGTSCALEDAVQLTRFSSAKILQEDTRCNIAARLYMWERNVVQPEALRRFGEGISEVTHFGSYNCRTIRGSRYMSEHSTGNAFDISGFRLRSGKLISVLRDWDSGPRSDFLHAVHDGLCDYFNLVLSPDYNVDHKDHFHVDMGWVRGCH